MLTLVKSRRDNITTGPKLTARRTGLRLPTENLDLRVEGFDVRSLSREGLASTPDIAEASPLLPSQGSFSVVKAIRKFGDESSRVLDFDFPVAGSGSVINLTFVWHGTIGVASLDSLLENLAKADQYLDIQWPTSPPERNQSEVLEAPPWLADRMDALQRMPPRSLQRVKTQFRAAKEMRSKIGGSAPYSAGGRKRPAN